MSLPLSSFNKYFFQETSSLHTEIVSLHDFVLPTATALWNFRNVIAQELVQDRLVTAPTLAKKYNTAPGTRGMTNLIIPFQTHTWEMQKERLSEVALVNIIALFEMWCDDLCEIFQRPELAVKLQYPSGSTASSGVHFVLNQLQLRGSTVIAGSIQSSLRQSKKYSISSLNNLLKCFRYFKEVRNCLMHRGRKCDGKLWGAQSEFKPVANQVSLGMDFIPEHFIVSQGDEVRLSFHGVLGFTDVILRIVTTVDAELAATPEGEQIIVRRIAELTQIPIKEDKLPGLFTTIGWPGTKLTPNLLAFLRMHRVIM